MNAYDKINEKMMELLEAGTVPWRRPWSGGKMGIPRNASTGKAYRGINAFMLAFSPYEQTQWVTYKQAQSLGGNVRHGEKSTTGFFFDVWEKPIPGEDKAEKIPVLKQFALFNLEQCDGLDDLFVTAPVVAEHAAIEECEAVLACFSGPSVEFGGSRACYRPSTDAVSMPPKKCFESAESYYSTFFHELGHSTGHTSRLARPGVCDVHAFGDPVYSKEELIAEFTAAYLCGYAGIGAAVADNNASYINSWLSVLKDAKTKRWLPSAMASAQKAADLILGIKPEFQAQS